MAESKDEKSKKKSDKKDRSSSKKPTGQTNALVRYIRETRGELRKVTWPTREESARLTLIVIGVTIFFSAFLFTFDWLFSSAVRWLIDNAVL